MQCEMKVHFTVCSDMSNNNKNYSLKTTTLDSTVHATFPVLLISHNKHILSQVQTIQDITQDK